MIKMGETYKMNHRLGYFNKLFGCVCNNFKEKKLNESRKQQCTRDKSRFKNKICERIGIKICCK